MEVVWGFVGCVVWSAFLALSLAEISSQYTVAGAGGVLDESTSLIYT